MSRKIKPSVKYIFPLFIFLSFIALTGFTKDLVKKANGYKNSGDDDKGEKTAAEFFKNIKVLKDMPASRLSPTMHFIEASVGLNCGSCHVRDQQKGWEFDKDDKPEKRKARKMIEMMNEINKNSFKGEQEVTCYTCHRGEPDPRKIPAVQTITSLKEKKAEQAQDDNIIKVENRLDTPAQIISKYIDAVGGSKVLKEISTLKYEGTVNDNGKNASVTIYKKAPDNLYYSVKFDRGEMIRAYNGKTAWTSGPFGTRELKGDDLDEIKLETGFYNPLDLEKIISNLKLEDISIVNGDTAYAIEGRASEYRTVKLFFSTRTGLLIRKIVSNKTPLGNLDTQTDYTDFRNVNGVLIPFGVHQANYENVQDIKFDNISSNVPVENVMFNMPKQ